MLLFMIKEAGEVHSILTSSDAAYKYLEELKKVHPDADWDIEHFASGRLPSHDSGAVWGYEGVYDLVTGEFHSIIESWIWRSQCSWQKPFNELRTATIISRFVPIYSDGSMDVSKWKRQVLKFFENFELVDIDGAQVNLKSRL